MMLSRWQAANKSMTADQSVEVIPIHIFLQKEIKAHTSPKVFKESSHGESHGTGVYAFKGFGR